MKKSIIVYLLLLCIVESSSAWIWPTVSTKITSDFGPRMWGGWDFHEGIDIKASVETQVYATEMGMAYHMGPVGGAGKYIEVHHPGGMVSRYLHLSEWLLEDSVWVIPGQLIAYSGNTGGVAEHLHFDFGYHPNNGPHPLKYLPYDFSPKPVIDFISPVNGQTVSGEIEIKVNVNTTVARDLNEVFLLVDLQNINNNEISYDPNINCTHNTVAPLGAGNDDFTFHWDTRTVDNGSHNLSVSAAQAYGEWETELIEVIVENEFPLVISTDPDSGAENVDVYTPITIAFNKEMEQTTINSGTILFSPPLHGGFSIQWTGDGKTVTLTFTNPQEDLEFYADYNIIVTDGVTDIDGTQLDGDRDGEPGGNYPFSFMTRVPNVIIEPPVDGVTLRKGQTIYRQVSLINEEVRGLSVDLSKNISDPGGWSVYGLPSGIFDLNPSEIKSWAYTVTNYSAEGSFNVQYKLIYPKGREEIVIDEAEYAYDPTQDDHPDEGPVVNPYYPTPWYLDTESQIGILLNGCFAGVGCIMGSG